MNFPTRNSVMRPFGVKLPFAVIAFLLAQQSAIQSQALNAILLVRVPQPPQHQMPQQQSQAEKSQTLDENTLVRVCRATVSAMMRRDVSIVRSEGVRDGIAYVAYNRPSDSTLWKNRCRVEGQQVIWSTVDAFSPGSGFGSWRVRPGDGSTTFSIDGENITIVETHADGSRSTKTMVVD